MSVILKKEYVQKIISSGEMTVFSIDPDFKNEISKKQIDDIVKDMKKHLQRKKKVHIFMVRE